MDVKTLNILTLWLLVSTKLCLSVTLSFAKTEVYNFSFRPELI